MIKQIDVKNKISHAYESYPFGSWPRIVLAFYELTGEDFGVAEFVNEKKEATKNEK